MKQYLFDYYSSSSIFLFIPTAAFLLFIYMIFLGQCTTNKKTIVFGLVFFQFRIVIGFIAPLISLFPNFGDTELFAKIISENYYPMEQSMGVHNYYYLTLIFRVLSLNDVSTFVLYQEFLYSTSLLIIYLSFNIWLKQLNYKANDSFLFLVLALGTFYPASILYISVPLRESFIIFAVAMFIYGACQFVVFNKILILIIGTVLVFMIRPQLLPALVLTLYLIKFNNKVRYYIPLLFMPPVLLYLFSVVFYEITPMKLSYIRNTWSESHGEQVYGVFDWNSWFDVLFNMPSLFFQYILSPFPILHDLNPFSMLAALIDVLYLIPLYIVMFFAIVRKNVKIIFSPFFIFSIITMTMSSLWEAYIGGAIRHRMISIIPIIPIVAYYLSLRFKFKNE